MTTEELAESLGYDPRQVRRWHDAGCPAQMTDGKLVWDEGVVRAWLADRARRGRGAGPADAPAARKGARSASASDQVPPDLAARIGRGATLGEIEKMAGEVAALTLSGQITPACSQAVRALLGERRQAIAAATTEAVGPELFVLEDGAELLGVFEGIVDARRRRAVLAHARLVAESDRLALGDLTDPEGVASRLAAAGLDAFGEPLPPAQEPTA